MLSELHSLNLKLCSKQYNKKIVLHLIVAPQLDGGWRHNYSTKTRQAGRANEQSMCSLMSMFQTYLISKLSTHQISKENFPFAEIGQGTNNRSSIEIRLMAKIGH